MHGAIAGTVAGEGDLARTSPTGGSGCDRWWSVLLQVVDGASLAAASAAAIALAKELSPTRGDKGGMAWSPDWDGDSRREITGLAGDSLTLFMF